MKYLLPCPACGQKTTVAPAQAGQSLRCVCGQSLEVPAMRHMRHLEQVADAEHPQSTWTRRQGLVFLGCAIVVFAAGFAGYLVWKMPRGVDAADIRAEVDALNPASSFICYQVVRHSLRPPLPVENPSGQAILAPVKPLLQITFENFGYELAPKQMKQVELQAKEREALAHWFPLIGGVAVVGLLIALSALVVRSESQRLPKKRAAAAS